MVGLHGPYTFLQASLERGSSGGALGDHLLFCLVPHGAEPALDGLAPLAACGVRDSGQVSSCPHHVDHIVNKTSRDASLGSQLRSAHRRRPRLLAS